MSTLTEDSIIDNVTVAIIDGRTHVHVRRANRVLRDGVVVSQQYHRHVLAPDDPIKDEDPLVQRITRAARKA